MNALEAALTAETGLLDPADPSPRSKVGPSNRSSASRESKTRRVMNPHRNLIVKAVGTSSHLSIQHSEPQP